MYELKPSELKPWLKYFPKDAVNAEVPQCTAYEMIRGRNADHRDDSALNYYGRRISFGTLLDSAEESASAFAALGVRKGDVVTFCTVTFPETVYAFYGLNILGATSNMVDPRTSPEGIREYLKESGSRYMIVVDAVFDKIKTVITQTQLERVIVLSPSTSLPTVTRALYKLANLGKAPVIEYDERVMTWESLMSRAGERVSVPYDKNTAATIMHTGGTTGTPKGVLLSNDNMNAMAVQFGCSGVHYTRDQRFLNIMPPFIAYGVICGLHTPLCNGLEVVIVPQFVPEKIGDLISKYKPSHMMGVPTHYEHLMNSPKVRSMDLSFFETSGSGGDTMNAALEAKLNTFLKSHNGKHPVSQGYGMTEVSAAASCNFNNISRAGSVGIPLLKTTIGVFKPGTTEELGIGEEGEICITGPTVMLGYLGREDETAKVKILHPDGQYWIHSGDMGRMDEDGFIFVEGRIKRMIIRFDGFKVFPSFIESVIARHPAVQACAVVGVADSDNAQGKLPLACIALKKEFQSSADEIRNQISELCGGELPEYALPVDYSFFEDLPRTSIGKVDYRYLEKNCVAPSLSKAG